MYLDTKIGEGAQADVYLYNNNAIKVFKENYNKAFVFYEAMITSFIENSGLPISKVHEVLNIDNKIAIKMDYIEGKNLNECLLSDINNAQNYIDIIVDLQIDIHSKNLKLPLSLKDKLKEKISGNTIIDNNKRKKLLEILNELPEEYSLCHGDFHGNNIINNCNGYYVIDWIDATNGCASADVCRTYMIYSFYSKELADMYLETYCTRSKRPQEDILAWLPVVAAARLSENNENEKQLILDWIENI
jgi:thiamine kinase-like enzyme